MSQDVKTRVLAAVSLEDLIGGSVSLKKSGSRRVGLCPFHAEKSPSFYVFQDHYYCFGCKETGDAISFVRKVHGFSFVEALKFLAEKFRVPYDPSEFGIRNNDDRPSKTTLFYQMLGHARKFFNDELHSPRGKEAREYLKERNFSPQQIKDLGFGLTPTESWGLCAALRKFGYKEADLAEVSLAMKSDRNDKFFDFFRQRIMIPIEDLQGRTVAFGGRTLNPGDPAKYKNSAAHPLFDKSKILFHLSRAKEHIRKKQRAIVVEGYMDALQLYVQEFPETVAVMGTAMTEHHLKILKNFTSEVILLFDGDAAGERASFKALDMVMSTTGVSVRVALLPKGYDPDSFLIEKGGDALEEILTEKAKDILDFVISAKVKSVPASGLPALIESEFVPWLTQVDDPLRKGFLVAKISEWSGIRPETLQARISGQRNFRVLSSPDKTPSVEAKPERKASARQAEFLSLLFFQQLSAPEVAEAQKILEEEFVDQPQLCSFADECLAYQRESVLPASLGIGSFASASDEKGMTLFAWLQTKKEYFVNVDLKKAFAALVVSFSVDKKKRRLSWLKQELRTLVEEDLEMRQKILGEIAQLLTQTAPSAM